MVLQSTKVNNGTASEVIIERIWSKIPQLDEFSLHKSKFKILIWVALGAFDAKL